MNRREFIASATVATSALTLATRTFSADAQTVFQERGYYLCFMRMPTFGLAVWQEILDECYSYVVPKTEFGEPWLVGKRQVPFGFGWLNVGANPYRELPVRAIRLVFRELTANPDLPDTELRPRLGRELFGRDWQPAQVDDLFFLFQIFNTDRDWSVPGALTAPGLVRHRAEHGHLDAKKRTLLREQLARVRAIAAQRHEVSSDGAKELHRIAQWLGDQWMPENEKLLTP